MPERDEGEKIDLFKHDHHWLIVPLGWHGMARHYYREAN
jgi:hypothetical protein